MYVCFVSFKSVCDIQLLFSIRSQMLHFRDLFAKNIDSAKYRIKAELTL